MRYYALTITNPSGQVYQVESNGLGFTTSAASQGATFSSLYTPWQNAALAGKPNPNALNIALDMPIAPLHTPQGKQLIRIWGLGIHCITQAQLANLNPVRGANGSLTYNTFTLRAGMSAGLPLANPAQQGIIAQGIIWQAFGNWEGTEQTLDLVVSPGLDTAQGGINWVWPKGTNLQPALMQMFRQAFPSYTPYVYISPNLVAPSDQKGHYSGLYTGPSAFAKYLQSYTQKLGAHGIAYYEGVAIITIGQSIYALDGTLAYKTKALAFQDLVGQPTWIDVNTITFPTVLRGDINYGDHVTFPSGVLLPYALTSPNAVYPNSSAASNVTFQGTFTVKEAHFYGNFREPDARSWNTTYTAIYTQPTDLVPSLS